LAPVMHILVGLIVVLAVSGSWLTGGYLGRVIMFLALSALLAFIGLRYVAYMPWDTVTTEVAVMVAGCIAGWFIAAIPMFLIRRSRVTQPILQQNSGRDAAWDTGWADKWIRAHDGPSRAPDRHP